MIHLILDTKTNIKNEDLPSIEKTLLAIINGIANGEYKEGNRNNIAVDLSIAAYLLNVDQFDLANQMEANDLIDHFAKKNLDRRLETIELYLPVWRCQTDDMRSFGINMTEWESYAESALIDISVVYR